MNRAEPKLDLRVKRIYEDPEPADGTRILVDRLWPRGVSKEAAALDRWMKEIAPSHALRKWFHADSDRWEEFVKRYTGELEDEPELVSELRGLASEGTVTLLYGARDTTRNHALVLADYLSRSPEPGAG